MQTCIAKLENENKIKTDEDVYDLTDKINNGQDYESVITPSIAASFLVLFFQKTYKPLFPVEEYDSIVGFPKLTDGAKKTFLKKMRMWMAIKEPTHLRIMLELSDCLRKLKDSKNLARDLACRLVRKQNGRYTCIPADYYAIVEFVEYCIDHVDFFCGTTETYDNGKCLNPATIR